ncbi:hypothetical protein L596_019847 [Steinernema carpocapsae]|uniref:EGF-like domain-containing protein n=1 Tax=Steinernema carpocapsae TaxID=34508 RepID=A0A4U5MRS9_STECR|nr:hypothetical protein L596_019847 [Steinernema carpocapsae]
MELRSCFSMRGFVWILCLWSGVVAGGSLAAYKDQSVCSPNFSCQNNGTCLTIDAGYRCDVMHHKQPVWRLIATAS